MTGDNTDRTTIARLAGEVVPALIDRLTRSELGELEVREEGWRVRLRRPMASNGEAPAAGASPASGHKQAPAPSHASHSPNDGHAPRRDLDRGLITSPAVGYYAPRDGVGVGSAISNGDLIGHVDVLGVRQEVVAKIDGTIDALEVEAGQAVEYGQPIARVAPERMVADV
ncbi:MAG TPA: biotin/lipoyl-containing protein [Candidatus Limnocylindrales bacterium]|nr:biotin/lipoyl-containing protein [Candidatus Limnocylindrales bacterium]